MSVFFEDVIQLKMNDVKKKEERKKKKKNPLNFIYCMVVF